jgi:hypothetical protein
MIEMISPFPFTPVIFRQSSLNDTHYALELQPPPLLGLPIASATVFW